MNLKVLHVSLSRFRGLYWKLSGAFLLLLFVLACCYVFITAFTAEMYYQEATQRLNAKLGSYLAAHTQPFAGEHLDRRALKSLFGEVMMINPSIEVYLIDSAGNILAYSAPDSVIRRRRVHMEPIRRFVQAGPTSMLMGDDPRSGDGEKAFSAAPIVESGQLRGYYYVILGGEQYASALQMLGGSYILRIGLRTVALTFIAAAVIGLLGFALLTRHLRQTIRTVRRFQAGELDARIARSTTPELDELATAFNEMADEIVRQIEEIRTMDTLRRDLVANISHDLRTPLVSIHGYVETILMKDHSLTPVQRRSYLETILKSTVRLKKLVEELLELSKLEAKQIAPTLERFSVAELVQDVVQKHHILADEQGITIQMKFSHPLPFVVGDIGLLERVFQNLLDNAIKYTGRGGAITVELSAAKEGVRVDIEDTGAGIAPEELSHIFDRFRRGPAGARETGGGMGLGLAIVKKILDIHGVTITVTSRLEHGTTFSFLLPFVERSSSGARDPLPTPAVVHAGTQGAHRQSAISPLP